MCLRKIHHSDYSATVKVEYPVNSPTSIQSVAVTPGSVTIVTIPNSSSQGWALNTVSNNSIRATADEEFVVYMVNRAPYTSDAALGLPLDALNTEYLVMNYLGTPSHRIGEVAITAPYDNTDVTITPSVALTGHAAGVPFTVTLQSGQGYLIAGQGNTIGTIIEASRPVSVTNGNKCANIPIPGTIGACDHIFEVAQPVQSWGKEILATNLPLRSVGSPYRILASQDGTTISQNGVSIGTKNRGEFIDTGAITGSHIFSADKPIYVGQFMTGQPSGGTGDPAFGNLIPFAQYDSAYTFSTVGGGQFSQNFVTIYAQNGDASTGSVLLDGSSVPAAEFTARVHRTRMELQSRVITALTLTYIQAEHCSSS